MLGIAENAEDHDGGKPLRCKASSRQAGPRVEKTTYFIQQSRCDSKDVNITMRRSRFDVRQVFRMEKRMYTDKFG